VHTTDPFHADPDQACIITALTPAHRGLQLNEQVGEGKYHNG